MKASDDANTVPPELLLCHLWRHNDKGLDNVQRDEMGPQLQAQLPMGYYVWARKATRAAADQLVGRVKSHLYSPFPLPVSIPPHFHIAYLTLFTDRMSHISPVTINTELQALLSTNLL